MTATITALSATGLRAHRDELAALLLAVVDGGSSLGSSPGSTSRAPPPGGTPCCPPSRRAPSRCGSPAPATTAGSTAP
ncbi:hypothetical protein [Streptomyces sp. NBC_01214]|uniref:hypothetical protein n=1 Tax=Streptomyces sp. NBC_01214 TaxID=2903777 RepID=UPI002B1E5711|nr:hypothetical protein [Streptomyces sp. NBC_01214]